MVTRYDTMHLPSAASTQDEARTALLASGEATLVVSDRQEQGRGRTGAPWLTAPRALASSFAFRPSASRPGWPVEQRGLLPLATGVALIDAIGRVAPQGHLALKWPNDLVSADSERKLGGILSEAVDDVVIIGCGVNLYWPDAPDGIGAVCDADPGAAMALEIATSWVDDLLASVDSDEWPLERYREYCLTLGREITWEPSGTGTAIEIAPNGALVVRTREGTRTHLVSGAVRHIRSIS